MHRQLVAFLSKPFDLDKVPIPPSNGGADYIRGYEHARKQSQASLKQLGNLNGVEPLISLADLPNDTDAPDCYSQGFNECLRNACKLFEETERNE